MNDILPGNIVWAYTREPQHNTFVIVARYLVSRGGQNREDDPDRRRGRRFFACNESGLTSFDPNKQNDIGEIIRQAIRERGGRVDAPNLGQALQAHLVSRISQSASASLAQHAEFRQLSSSSPANSVPFDAQTVTDNIPPEALDSNGVHGISPADADQRPYDPSSIADGRERIKQSVVVRRGQQQFRDDLLDAYSRCCAITGCDIVHVLEAAHVTPYLGPATNVVTNGLLLRSDLHTLFDCGLLAIDPQTRSIVLDPSLRNSVDYGHLHSIAIRSPASASKAPSAEALEDAWQSWLRAKLMRDRAR